MKRTHSMANPQQRITQYGTSYKRRPFKRVRFDGSGLVPYGRSQLYTAARNPLSSGVRNVKKGMDTMMSDAYVEPSTDDTLGIYPLNLLLAGTGSWNRIGRMIQMKSLRIRLKATCDWNLSPFIGNSDSTIALPPNRLDAKHLRMVIVYDKQPNGTLPKKSDIFQYKTADGTESGYWDGFLAYDNMERFKILRDEVITFDVPPIPFIQHNPTNQTNFEVVNYAYPPIQVERHLDIYMKLNLRTNYKSESTTPTIADISTGAIYCIFMVDPAQSASPPTVTCHAVARLRYLDQ